MGFAIYFVSLSDGSTTREREMSKMIHEFLASNEWLRFLKDMNDLRIQVFEHEARPGRSGLKT